MYGQSQYAQQSQCLQHLGGLADPYINMRVLIAMSCFLAVASAGYYDGAPAHGGQYQGPLHIPVLDHNGVPVEPKEVQEARKNHLAAFSGVQTAPAHNYGYTAPQQHYQPQYNAPQHNYQSQHVPVVDAQGVPQDAPDVAAAKAAHFAAYAQVNARAAPAGRQNYGYSVPQDQYQPPYTAPQHQYQPQQPQHVPVIDIHGVPQDAPDVAAAKAAHFAAYAQVNARAAPAAGHYNAAPAHYAPAGHNAGPIDTPEVAAAKATHFAAHAQVAQPQQPHHYNQW